MTPDRIARDRLVGVLVVLFLSLAIGEARAQTQTVLACTADWGANASCGGCSGLVWADPATDPKVYSPDRTYWDRLSVLTSTQRVAVSTNPPGAATCQTSNLVTKAALAGGTTAPPTPPTTTPPSTANGTATLTWTLSTTRTDGTPLTNLASTEVFAGLSTTSLASVATVPVPATTYTVTGLVNGTWYFATRAVTTTGEVSALTNPVSLAVSVTPQTCGPKPVDETQAVQCAAPQVGSWTQTRTFTAAAFPTCWAATAWTPATAPAGACTTPAPAPTWRVATNGTSATRPAYELILNADGTATVRGYQLGTVAVGRPCGDVKEISGTTEFRRVSEADVTLQSPTYRGRVLVAVCSRQ